MSFNYLLCSTCGDTWVIMNQHVDQVVHNEDNTHTWITDGLHVATNLPRVKRQKKSSRRAINDAAAEAKNE